MKTEHQQRIEAFMRKACQTVPTKPTMPDAAIRVGRARLIFEECMETIEALGCELVLLNGEFVVRNDWLKQPSMVETIDGCIDISVVTIGTLSALGVPDQPFLEEVDAANLRKFEGDAHIDQHGKWIKPTGFKPPDIEGVLNRVKGSG